jgi:PIN domain nuclease of toxin-antitoxin system
VRLLLDTQVLLWALAAPERLPKPVQAELAVAEVYFSAASIWEIALHRSAGRLAFDAVTIVAAAEETRFTAVAVSVRHVTATAPLVERHRDPFDRLLLAQALTEPLVLLTNDANLAAHGHPVRLLSSRLS